MRIATTALTAGLLVYIAILAGVVWLLVLCARALRKYIGARETRQPAVESEGVGQAIKRLREERGMTQELLAEAIGVSRQAVSKWESGRASPGTANLQALSALFGMPPEELTGPGSRG